MILVTIYQSDILLINQEKKTFFLANVNPFIQNLENFPWNMTR